MPRRRLNGCRAGYYFLSIDLVVSIVHVQINNLIGMHLGISTELSLVNFMHIIVMSFLIADAIKYATQVFYYRRDS